jgi:hypothetical protein
MKHKTAIQTQASKFFQKGDAYLEKECLAHDILSIPRTAQLFNPTYNKSMGSTKRGIVKDLRKVIPVLVTLAAHYERPFYAVPVTQRLIDYLSAVPRGAWNEVPFQKIVELNRTVGKGGEYGGFYLTRDINGSIPLAHAAVQYEKAGGFIATNEERAAGVTQKGLIEGSVVREFNKLTQNALGESHLLKAPRHPKLLKAKQ